jgi:tetratricopeptide (TPR) repeat protein
VPTPFVPAQESAQSPSPSATPAAQQPIVDLPRAKSTTPQDPPTFEDRGDSLLAQKRYQAAIEAYKQAPKNVPAVWNKMGIAYQLMFNLQDAERCYESSLKLDSKNPRVLNNLGTVYDALKHYSDAERSYHKALKYDPNSAMIYKNLGTALLAEHRYKKGWEAYQFALKIDPQIFQSHESPRVENPGSVEERGAMNYYMARGCVRAGMNDCAIDYLRMALNEGFTNPKKIQADSDFAALRGIPAFDQLLASQTQSSR